MITCKPRDVRVEAVEWTGDWSAIPAHWKSLDLLTLDAKGNLIVRSPNGPVRAELGWFVIHGLAGEFYPVPAAIFHQRWEKADG